MVEEYEDEVTLADLSRTEFYELVRAAFKDALLDVIGTMLLVGIGLVLLWGGLAGAATAAGGESPAFALVGIVVALAGVYVAAAALEYVPSVEQVLRAD